MRLFISLLGCSVFYVQLLITGCFTDVGNAEDESVLEADFAIDYSRGSGLPKVATSNLDTVTLTHFYLNVVEAEYYRPNGGEYHLWRNMDIGMPVDFTGKDVSAKLPDQKFQPDSILGLELYFQIPKVDAILPDTLHYDSFKKLGYIKGTYSLNGFPIRFLFALPDTEVFELHFSSAQINDWRNGDRYQMAVRFFALQWITQAGIGIAAYSLDHSGLPFVLIDQDHNVPLFNELSERFFQSFNSGRSRVR